jgi:hypothetical protein
MSITKMIDENSDSGAPRFSAVTFAGVSQISNGMTVLERRRSVNVLSLSQSLVCSLDLVLHDTHRRLEIERLFRG